jgi:uncharacterized RDD family membrane protein YckC
VFDRSGRAATGRPASGRPTSGRATRHRGEPDCDRTAGLVSRGIVAVLDLIVVLVTLCIAYLAAVLLRLALLVHEFRWPTTDPFFTAGAVVVLSVLYLAGCWSVSGRTPGAVAMGLQVVSAAGRPLSFPVALLRAVIVVLFPVGLLWSAVDARRRAVADLLLGTRVRYSH